MLEVGNPSDAARRLDEDEKHTLGNSEGIADSRVQNLVVVNEGGLFTLVLRCHGAIKTGTVPHRCPRLKWRPVTRLLGTGPIVLIGARRYGKSDGSGLEPGGRYGEGMGRPGCSIGTGMPVAALMISASARVAPTTCSP